MTTQRVTIEGGTPPSVRRGATHRFANWLPKAATGWSPQIRLPLSRSVVADGQKVCVSKLNFELFRLNSTYLTVEFRAISSYFDLFRAISGYFGLFRDKKNFRRIEPTHRELRTLDLSPQRGEGMLCCRNMNVSGSSSVFQRIPAYSNIFAGERRRASRLFPLIPAYSKIFQLIPG